MKELSIEEKAKRYDDAINAIKELKAKHPTAHVIKDWIKENFPELTESDDERIRKYIINHLQEHLKTVREFLNNGMSAPFSSEEIKMLEASVAWLEKQGENISLPKFKVGDWITNGKCTWKIDLIDEGMYYTNHCRIDCGGDIKSIDEEYHLWTIQDAKDGDILFQDLMCGKTFIYNGINPNMAILYSFIISNDGKDVLPYYIGKPNTGIGNIEENKNIIHPATKEQRDLLFKKIHETGYEWDAEELELKKIEQGLAWSEEDENRINRLIAYFEDKESFTAEDDIVYANWLNSLKERYTWKPSDEQMDMLKIAVSTSNSIVLDSLYNDLMKLKE